MRQSADGSASSGGYGAHLSSTGHTQTAISHIAAHQMLHMLQLAAQTVRGPAESGNAAGGPLLTSLDRRSSALG